MSDKPKVLKLSGKMLVIPINAPAPDDLAAKVEALLAVPEVRKAAANWAADELLAVRYALAEAKEMRQ